MDYRWDSFWDGIGIGVNGSGSGTNSSFKSEKTFKKWTIEISGLDERFAANFLEKFCISNRYPKMPDKSADDLSYYGTIYYLITIYLYRPIFLSSDDIN